MSILNGITLMQMALPIAALVLFLTLLYLSFNDFYGLDFTDFLIIFCLVFTLFFLVYDLALKYYLRRARISFFRCKTTRKAMVGAFVGFGISFAQFFFFDNDPRFLLLLNCAFVYSILIKPILQPVSFAYLEGCLCLFDGLATRIPLESVSKWQIKKGTLEIYYQDGDKMQFNLTSSDLDRFKEQMTTVLEPSNPDDE